MSADIVEESRPDAVTYFFTMFCTACVVICLLFLEINSALVFTFNVLRICNQVLIDFLAAGVKKILRSLLPLATTLNISLADLIYI